MIKDLAASVMGRLLILFIVVPMAELALLLQIGQWVGIPATLALIVVTGAVGAYLARWQGFGVLRRLQSEMAAGRVPAEQIVDGMLILVAGAVLLTPGILTDGFGFFCLVPAGRTVLKRAIARYLRRSVQDGKVRVSVDFGANLQRTSPNETHDVTVRTVSRDDPVKSKNQ